MLMLRYWWNKEGKSKQPMNLHNSHYKMYAFYTITSQLKKVAFSSEVNP